MSRCSTQRGTLRRGRGPTVLSPATSECFPLNLAPTLSVIAGGRGRSLPARLAVGFNAITVSAVDTPPRLQRPIAESCHDCSDSSHLSGINDVTPSAFDMETQSSTYRGAATFTPGRHFVSKSAGFSFPGILDMWILPFRSKS